jgi:hypothetical protein
VLDDALQGSVRAEQAAHHSQSAKAVCLFAADRDYVACAPDSLQRKDH